MTETQKVNILIVDDQPAKLLSYEAILNDLGENLIRAASGREALERLLKFDIALILIDVCMPELDGFQLAQMIRDHPRFQKVAIIFISAIQIEDVDRLRGYEMGAVDYVPVPVIPAVLRAKVRVFLDLYRKTQQLQQLNDELERRVAERTAELRSSMERQALLTREVDHRAKNTLALVQSIMRLTRAPTIDLYVEALEGRVHALARVHGALAEARWRSADLRSILTSELAPFRSPHASTRTACEGPTVLLQPAVAQIIALVMHELATNAAKYGALSRPEGRVAVSWELQQGTLALRWQESGGPPVTPPASQGFGTRITKASVERQLGGRLEFDWDGAGLGCRLSLPIAQEPLQSEPASAEDPMAPGGAAEHGGTVRPVGMPRRGRILLVEDETFIGWALRDILTDAGYEVVGPVARLREAVAAASGEAVDHALIDVNLGGELSYPVAEALRSRGTGFVFLTGYNDSAIDRRFADVPVLNKPIDTEALLLLLANRLPAQALLRAVAQSQTLVG